MQQKWLAAAKLLTAAPLFGRRPRCPAGLKPPSGPGFVPHPSFHGPQTTPLRKQRIEVFSDGMLAIILIIMVLEIKVPPGDSFAALRPLLPVVPSFVLSFVYIGIYWNNHHHMLSSTAAVSGTVLWTSLHLLFWLSLVPFATGWMGENHFAPATLAVYGGLLLMAGVAYNVLQNCIIALNGPNSVLAHAVGRDWKGKASPVLYGLGIAASFWLPWVAGGIYVAVALM